MALVNGTPKPPDWMKSLPDFGVRDGQPALMTIDMQYVDAHPDGALGRRARAENDEEFVKYYFERLVDTVIPNLQRLHDVCRTYDVPLIHVRLMSLSTGGSDSSWRLRNKTFGKDGDSIIQEESASLDVEFLPEVAPRSNELVINKTTSGAFTSTNLDFVLRSMGVDTLVLTGVGTNGCVETTARHAADLNYRVLIVEDACATLIREEHEHALQHLDRNYVHVKTTEELLRDIRGESRS
jgi:nicotinamidase-related amidase